MALTYLLRKHSNRFLWVLLWLIFLPHSFAQSTFSDFQFKKVGSVQIVADGPIDQEFLLDLIELTPNVDILTASKVRKSIELLYATGNFTNVLVDAVFNEGRVDLKFILRTVYRIKFVHLKGQLGVSGKKIRRKLQLRKLESYTPEKILKGREDILSVLLENGYYNARIMQDVLLHRSNKRADIIYTIQAGSPAYARSLQITGNPYFPQEKIVSAIKSHPAKRFREVELTKDLERIEAIYDKNGFLEHDIQIEKKELTPQNQINLAIRIEAGNQLIFKVEGYDFSERLLHENIPVWAEESYNDDTLEEGRRNLVHYLQTKGYYDAKVTWKKDVSAENIQITYKVEPGTKYGVESIQIVGNKHLSRDEILKSMNTKESGTFGGAPLVTKVFESDSNRILSAYRLHGFLFARITKKDVVRLPDGKLKVELQIDEGPQSFLAELRIKGNKAISTEEFLSHFQQKIGEPISERQVKTDSNYVVALYSDRGFPKAQMDTKLLFSQDKTRVILEYRIEEGEQIFVNRIVASGNYRTTREVIEESLYFHEDSPFSLRKISESQSKLYALNIFDRVDIQVPRPDNLQKFQNVYIRLREAKPYTISYGFGYQTFDLLHGIFALSNRNWLGTARTWGVQLRGGFKERRALLSYVDPHLFFHAVTNTLNAFAEHRVRPSFSFSRYGGTLQVQKLLSKGSPELQIGELPGPTKSLFLRYAFEDIRTTSGTPGTDPQDRRFLPIHISSVSASFVRDARDNFVDPTSGTYFSTDLQYAAYFLGSGSDFLKSTNQAQYYVPAGKTVIATSLRIGLAEAFRNTIVPISQQFFAGGGRTIRGFELDTARVDENGDPVGGNMSLILNLEYRFPLFGPLGGVVFFDYGNVFPLIEEFELSELRRSTGIGLRYKTPIGPVSFDWGYKLDRTFNGARQSPYEFFFSVGHVF